MRKLVILALVAGASLAHAQGNSKKELVARLGWEELGRRIPVRCFNNDPSVASSLTFLRRTPWARSKVEELYLLMQRERQT